MRIIQQLSEMMEEEIEDAEKYARCALKNTEERPKLADLFYSLSKEELEHMERLHNMVVEIIMEYRRDHGEPPAEMMAVYNYLHSKQIDHVKDVRTLQDMYK